MILEAIQAPKPPEFSNKDVLGVLFSFISTDSRVEIRVLDYNTPY